MSETNMTLTVYARKLPNGGVAIYRDKAATNQFCQFESHLSNKPTRRNKWVTVNCYRWALEWI